MNRQKLIVAGAWTAILAPHVIIAVNAIVEGHRERKAIRKQTEITIAAMDQSKEAVIEMINEGLYDGKSPTDVLKDFNAITEMYKSL